MQVYGIPVGALQTNCYLIELEDKTAFVLDPGSQGKELISILEKKGLTPSYLVLTHGHHDHIGAVHTLKERYPQAKIAIGAEDAPLLSKDALQLPLSFHLPEDCYIEPEIRLQEGDRLETGGMLLEVLHTPGHTRGGICLLCRQEGLLFSGDTLFDHEIGRCDLYGGDYPTMLKTLRRLAALPEDYQVLPGHGNATLLSVEKRENPYFQEALREAE